MLFALESVCIRCSAGLFCLVAESIKDKGICNCTCIIRKRSYGKAAIKEIIGCGRSLTLGDKLKATGIVNGICSVRCLEYLRVS